MVSVETAKAEVAKLLKARFPKSAISRVDISETVDSDGQPSLKVLVVFLRNPAKAEMRYERSRLIDDLRTWLSRSGDERFPYFSFLTEKDERELSNL